MYSLVVVDDEPAIRQGLANQIDWDGLGFEVVGEFDDGEDALPFIRAHRVDAVLTDIRMSVMSGLELADHIRSEHLPPVVVLLTGFRDFEYARHAMRAGVSHYLLKPTQPDEITEVFAHVRAELDERSVALRGQRSRRRIDRLVADARRQLLLNLISGTHLTEESLARAWRRCLLDMPSPEHQVSYRRFELTDASERILLTLGSECSALFQDDDVGQTVALRESDSILHFLVVSRSQGDVDPGTVLGRLLRRIAPEGDRIVAGHGSIQSATSLAELLAAVSIGCRDDGSTLHATAAAVARGIARAAIAGEGERIRDLVSAFLAQCNLADDAESSVRRLAINLVAATVAEIARVRGFISSESGVDYEWPFRLSETSDIIEWAASTLVLAGSDAGDLQKGADDVVDQIRRYIADNLGSNLTLERVAPEFLYSPGYLSRLFSEKTGTNYSQYVTERRVERATALLGDRPDMRVQDIASTVGYQDTKHFARVFRSMVGLTPSAYRRLTGSRVNE